MNVDYENIVTFVKSSAGWHRSPVLDAKFKDI